MPATLSQPSSLVKAERAPPAEDGERVLQASFPMRPFAIAVFLLLAGCEKAPPEPVAPSRSVSEAIVRAKPERPQPKGPRCLHPLPKEPPPPVEPASHCPPDPEGGPPKVPTGVVEFDKGPARLEVELMLNDLHRARGMMYRTSLDENRGMLFAWPTPGYRSFWMRDTCIPLDMLFIDEEGYVAGIVENVPPLNDESRGIDCRVQYVLEVKAGWARKHGIVPGDRVRIEGVPWS